MRPIDETSDEELLARFARGHDDAFERLVERHGGGVKAYARRLLRDEALAEDVYVETFTRVVRERDRLRPLGTVRGYLYTIAHRICIDLTRRRRTEREARAQLIALESRRHTPPSSEAQAIAGELAADLEAGIAALSCEHRQVLLLRVVHGLSTREVAAAVGLDEPQVRSQLSWARKRLRAHLHATAAAPSHRVGGGRHA